MPQPILMKARPNRVTAALFFRHSAWVEIVGAGTAVPDRRSRARGSAPLRVLHLWRGGWDTGGDGLFGSSLRVQLGRTAEGASARGVAVGRGGAAQQSCISTERNRTY